MSNFEDRLWSQLVHERGDQMRAAPGATAALQSSLTATRPDRSGSFRLRHPALLTGAGLGLVGLATAGVLAFGASAPAAFAVYTRSGGTVAITLSDLSALPALNQKLEQEGIPVVGVPMSATCPTSARFMITTGVPLGTQPTSAPVIIDPSQIPTGDVGVLGVMQADSGRWALVTVDAPAPGPSCLNSTAFTAPIHTASGASVPPALKARPAPNMAGTNSAAESH